MIASLFIWGGVVTWLTFVAATAVANRYFKNQVNKEASASIGTAFKGVTDSLGRIEKHLQGKEQNARLSEPKEATRVYAALVQRQFETRLLVQPANTFEDMSNIVVRELGTGWMVLISAYTDVLGWKDKLQSESSAALVETPIANFVHDLEYSRDKFAESPTQKKALDAIIKKVKEEHYGRSNA